MRSLRHVNVGCTLLIGLAACGGDSPTQASASCTAASAQAITLAVGDYVSIDPATNNGCVRFPANASTKDTTEYLLVPQSVASAPNDSAPFYLLNGARLLPATQSVRGNLAPPIPRRRSIGAEFDAFLRRAARNGFAGMGRPRHPNEVVRAPIAGAAPACPATGSLAGSVGCVKTFIVCDTVTCQTTVNVAAQLRSLGNHVAFFVDTLAPAGGLTVADLDSLKPTFDTLLYPLDTVNFGAPSDIDNNGVVIILMTGVVNQLVTKAFCDSVGFVLGFFFGGDLYRQTSFNYNHGEIYYSLVADPDSTLSCAHPAASVKRQSPRTFVHELEHMVNFAQHSVLRGGSQEEGWLDEGLATYAEELAADHYLLLGDIPRYNGMLLFGDLFDAYEYLYDPGSYYLMIPQDDGTIGEIGASWLFVRYLMDQFGPGLAAKLVQTAQFGSANITAQTGKDYRTLLSNWAFANWVSDLPGFTAKPEHRYTSWQFRTVYDTLRNNLRAQGDSIDFPRPFPLVPASTLADSVYLVEMLRSGSAWYWRAVQRPGDPAFTLAFVSTSLQPIAARAAPRLNVIRLR